MKMPRRTSRAALRERKALAPLLFARLLEAGMV
jgi:hypothetical protein